MFSQNLKEYRKKKGFSRQDMADKLNMTAAAYGFYEQGKTKPDVDKLIIIARMLEVSPNELLDFHYDEFEYYKRIWNEAGFNIERHHNDNEEDYITYKKENSGSSLSTTISKFLNLSKRFEEESKKAAQISFKTQTNSVVFFEDIRHVGVE